MKPLYLGLSAVGWHAMVNTTWGKVIASFLLASTVLAIAYVIYHVIRYVTLRLKERRPKDTIPRPVARYLKSLRQSCSSSGSRVSEKSDKGDAKSFGAYLGSFASPPTAAQHRVLTRWDILVLDPTQEGVAAALASYPPVGRQVLARLDTHALMQKESSGSAMGAEKTLSVLDGHVKQAAAGGSGFSGVLLCEFDKYLQPAVVNEFARYVRDLGLDLWIELSYPDYISETYAQGLDTSLTRGVIYRNGTMRPDGDRQNYFQMSAMRAVMRTMAAQRVSPTPALIMWEVVDNEMELQYAVVTRTFSWCTYYSALCWVGRARALTDAEVAETDSIPAKPLGALMWLKNEKNMKAHDVWRGNDEICLRSSDASCAVLADLSPLLPDLATRLRLLPAPEEAPPPRTLQAPTETALLRPGTPSDAYSAANCLSVSSKGDDLTGLGCFQVGQEASFSDFSSLRAAQQNLKELDLLAIVGGEELAGVRAQIERLRGARELSPKAAEAVGELLALLDSGRLQVLSGLHSGFRVDSGTQYYGVYDFDTTGIECNPVIFLSNKSSRDRAGTILHTFLSSRQLTRTECFLAEQVLAAKNGRLHERWQLPPRLVSDAEQLSPTEALLFLRRLEAALASSSLSSLASSAMLAHLRTCLSHQLLDVPTLTQLRALCATGYLSGAVSAEDMVDARLAWLRAKGCAVPARLAALQVFHDVEERVLQVLMDNEADVFALLGTAMQDLCLGPMDAAGDMLALAVFSALRKLALDEMYLEVLDRNVYPNHSADQAGCFAENFGLGSRCDSFFDTTPRHVGRIISDRYRAYYTKYQPPLREPGFTELPTAYFAMQVDFDPEDGAAKVPFYYRVTFFSIFALPALVDVLLLTTIGRGLYLTTYMTSQQKTMATTALMLSLLMSGSLGAWICSGGTYYFFSNAFPAMNMFILTRFVAGIAVTVVAAIGGFITVLFVHNVHSALVFLFYFSMLSTYMLVLNALSIYQQPGSSFLSGRTTIIRCIPILFISPIVSMFTQHDIVVYVPVLSAFVIALLIGARSTIAQWSAWYLNIPSVKDSEIIAWYRTKNTDRDLSGMKDNDVMPLARAALHSAVLKETRRWTWFERASSDAFVRKLAVGYEATLFLMQWYSKHKRARMPLVYSTTWNLTLKAAMENMTNMQKGLKLHSAFLHWRSTGKDIWSAFLYFVVALLDKWIAIFTGSSLVGLSAASSEIFRTGVGFGLCYYLFGAVALDIVSQPLWIAANTKNATPIDDLAALKAVTASDAANRRRLYTRSLLKFFFLHLWGTSVFAALIWVFQDTQDNTIMFLSYVGAYSGLLLYQYNKIFCGPGVSSALPLAIGFVVGLPVGLAVHLREPAFGYSGVICLASATWTACLVSFWTADLGWFSVFRRTEREEAKPLYTDDDSVYTFHTTEPSPVLAQSTLRKVFDAAESRYRLDPGHPGGLRVLDYLAPEHAPRLSGLVAAAFPRAQDMLAATQDSWRSGHIVVDLVSAQQVLLPEAKILHIARKTNSVVHLLVVASSEDEADHSSSGSSMDDKWRATAQALLQAVAEHRLGLSHDDAHLAALLVVDYVSESEVGVPEGIKLQLAGCAAERERITRAADATLLRHTLLGVDCEREWDHLPEAARRCLVARACGRTDEDDEVATWLCARIDAQDANAVDVHMARSALAVALTRAVLTWTARLDRRTYQSQNVISSSSSSSTDLVLYDSADTAVASSKTLQPPKPVSSSPLHKLQTCLKFLILSLTADPEYQRELHFVTRKLPGVLRWPLIVLLNGIWSYCKLMQTLLIPLVLFHGRDHVATIRRRIRGMKTVLEKNRLVTESFAGPSTWFWATLDDGRIQLSQYAGHRTEPPPAPQSMKELLSVNTYSDKLILQERELYSKGEVASAYAYEYADAKARLPLQRRCTSGKNAGESVQYDSRGYIASGSAVRGVNRVSWRLYYRKNAKHEDELLWAEYTFPHITIKVLWSMPPRNGRHKRLEEWIPFSTVTEATFLQGEQVYHASWDYEHKFHPEVAVTLNGQPVETPAMIREDWFHVLDKPADGSFRAENPLLPFASLRSNPVARFFGGHVRRTPIPTSVARTQLWKAWRSGRDVDAISARWLDEKLLRADRIMRRYWRLRDWGRLAAATAYLDAQADSIMARVDIDPQTSSWTHLAFKTSDFYGFGPGGDARINTRKIESQLWETTEAEDGSLGGDSELHVLAMDTSTWPNDPGGVSACRRDMVNDLRTIKWHVVAESANDFGVPRFQIERNVQSLTILPLWGLDFLNPTHGVLEPSLDSAVVQRSLDTRSADIETHFLPILESLVTCSRAIYLDRRHVDEATRALVDLNTYFETSRNWNDVWQHPVVKRRWRQLWLAEMPNTLSIGQWWDFEKPTMQQLDDALNLWCRYLFIFSLPVPEHIPDVFQASHHFTGATYGIVCKAKRRCTLHIWDHCISFREFTNFMSSAVSFDAPFVNSSLISLTHLSCVLLEHHADVVLPCCDYFNPGWEVELGTAEGALEHRATFARKIDPVVNGICNMEKFEPIKTIKTATPTVVMLSHIQYAKDIKNAIMATDIIVNRWGFTDYQLHIYGDQERAAAIATECQELIASKNLQDHCILKGLGNPSVVLQDAWLFLNSSISEGLPLAMGEAALTGVPVVCTDVGASFCVVTDRATDSRFSEVVSPNDSESLARAQISVMGLLGPWAQYAEDAPGEDAPVLTYPNPTPAEVRRISDRMYAKTDQRRALGMRGRQNVLNNFSSERYLREHEQMLWVGKYNSLAYRGRLAAATAAETAENTMPGTATGTATPGSGRSSFIKPPPYGVRARPLSRLTPESWISLSSEETAKSGWRSATPSVRDFFKEKKRASSVDGV